MDHIFTMQTGGQETHGARAMYVSDRLFASRRGPEHAFT
jgi:hypothetical protein